MSWRQALWEKVALSDDDVTVMDPPDSRQNVAVEGVVAEDDVPRAEPRYTADEIPAITAVQLSGEQVTLLNISSSGILVESDARIKPGERVKLSISGLTAGVVSGVVVRCVVSSISNGGRLRYESGIAFGERVTLPLGPAALRTSNEVASASPDGAIPAAISASLLEVASVSPGAPALPAAAAASRRALPRVRNRW